MALMKERPTSGPIPKSNTHQARDTMSSRNSLSRSHTNAGLGEGKEHLFKVLVWSRLTARRSQLGELRNAALAANSSVTQEDEAVADARGIADLMNREEQRTAAGSVSTEGRSDVARLAQVEAFERLVDEQCRLRRQQADAQKSALPLTF